MTDAPINNTSYFFVSSSSVFINYAQKFVFISVR